jgi:hypothetical protein
MRTQRTTLDNERDASASQTETQTEEDTDGQTAAGSQLNASTIYRGPSKQVKQQHVLMNRRLKLAQDQLNRIQSLERLVEGNPRLLTRRKRMQRSVRMREEVVAGLKTRMRRAKTETEEAKPAESAPSKIIRDRKRRR